MLKLFKTSVIIFLTTSSISCISQEKNTIDLSGEWAFQIDSLDEGTDQHWFTKKLNNKIKLPGSMATNNKGDDITVNTKWTGGIWDSIWYKSPEFAKYREPGNVKISFWLQPLKHYVGVAWYQKKINIPASWKNKYIELFLERCHWETTLWIDDQQIGMQNSLSAPHIYDLCKSLTAGEHTLTLRIDNRVKDINPGLDAHSITDNTQTNWNGIIGEMKLIERSAIYIKDIQVFPDVDKKLIQVNITINNITGKESNYKLHLSASIPNDSEITIIPFNKTIHVDRDTTQVRIRYPMGDHPLLWDEFHPNLYTLKTTIVGNEGRDSCSVDFGMRKFAVNGRMFSMNDRSVFLRGTLECAIFPKTGFPSTAVDDWLRIFKICKSYGLNHIRFHSWCPPEAAFEAADRSGMYLSIECDAWATIGDGKPIDQFIYDESNRIVTTYGNHPSFCMMLYGNEPSGDNVEKYLTGFVQYWKNKDNRRLYASASGWGDVAPADYVVNGSPRIQMWQAGLTSIINSKPPSTSYDWNALIDSSKPTVSHEIGQWCVYPNFKEIKKYTGVLKPKNFDIFYDRLKEHGIENLADSFLLASGKLQVLCYKADIEAALRTPLAGFQLLDLHDFPGQGTALVGVLDAFWDNKGYVTPKEYKSFCNTTIPLVRLQKMIYLNNETLSAKVEIAHYGEHSLKAVTPKWKLTHTDGAIFTEGKLTTTNIPFGNMQLGSITTPLNSIKKPEKLKLTIAVDTFQNAWDIWVYPSQLPYIADEQKIRVTQTFDKATEDYLQQGGIVLLTPKKGSTQANKGGNIEVGFSSIFWNTQWTEFKQPPFTLGILCDPKHPALAEFPTEYHSNYQWWDAMSHCNVIRIDSVSSHLLPVVRVIDDWFTARPLALIFECKVGKGKLLVSGIDLLTDEDKRPEARQLLYSLKKYMASDKFNPSIEVDEKIIRSLMSDE